MTKRFMICDYDYDHIIYIKEHVKVLIKLCILLSPAEPPTQSVCFSTTTGGIKNLITGFKIEQCQTRLLATKCLMLKTADKYTCPALVL